jgi:hypothetical protein
LFAVSTRRLETFVFMTLTVLGEARNSSNNRAGENGVILDLRWQQAANLSACRQCDLTYLREADFALALANELGAGARAS